jgi:hypothetical protein
MLLQLRLCMCLRRSRTYDPPMSYKYLLGRIFLKEWYISTEGHRKKVQRSLISA